MYIIYVFETHYKKSLVIIKENCGYAFTLIVILIYTGMHLTVIFSHEMSLPLANYNEKKRNRFVWLLPIFRRKLSSEATIYT